MAEQISDQDHYDSIRLVDCTNFNTKELAEYLHGFVRENRAWLLGLQQQELVNGYEDAERAKFTAESAQKYHELGSAMNYVIVEKDHAMLGPASIKKAIPALFAPLHNLANGKGPFWREPLEHADRLIFADVGQIALRRVLPRAYDGLVTLANQSQAESQYTWAVVPPDNKHEGVRDAVRVSILKKVVTARFDTGGKHLTPLRMTLYADTLQTGQAALDELRHGYSPRGIYES